jgi:quercetin dioxygenase-like cupin family protein
MQKLSLQALAREQLSLAASATSGRSARTVYGGHEHVLRQTVIALTAGHSLAEHDNPGDATILVLSGRVRLTAGTVEWEARQGDLLLVPSARHSLLAIQDATVLLSASSSNSAS